MQQVREHVHYTSIGDSLEMAVDTGVASGSVQSYFHC